MTDEQISEIYALARESFLGGQSSFQIQAFPFRMTALNMAKHRNSPHLAFWKMLKQGYDHFQVTRLEPKVDVCERRYVFNAEASGRFSAADRCPAYRVPEDIVAAVREKQRRDDSQTAELINRGTPTVPARMGVDGGMNETFLAAVKQYGGPGATIRTAAGTIPAHAQPPAEPSPPAAGTTMSLASAESRPAPGPRSSVQVASAGSSGGIGGFFGNLFGARTEDRSGAQGPAQWGMPVGESAAKPKAAPAAAKPASAKGMQTAAKPKSEPRSKAEARPKSDPPPAASRTATAYAPQPAAAPQEASPEPDAKPASTVSLLNGAAPTVPAGAFDGRFGPWR
jgi:hypothetical protein